MDILSGLLFGILVAVLLTLRLCNCRSSHIQQNSPCVVYQCGDPRRFILSPVYAFPVRLVCGYKTYFCSVLSSMVCCALATYRRRGYVTMRSFMGCFASASFRRSRSSRCWMCHLYQPPAAWISSRCRCLSASFLGRRRGVLGLL